MAVRLLGDFLLHPSQWTLRGRAEDDPKAFSRRCQVRRRVGMIWGLLTYSEVVT
jgi:hypothetical protein